MPEWLKNIFKFLISIVIVTAFGLILFFYKLSSSLPEKNKVVETDYLTNRVEIFRDENEIPFINAVTGNDAAFALGYVHAQDRLFQMDLFRRAAEGRLSEIIGTKTLPFDIMFKTIGLDRIARQTIKQTDTKLLDFLNAYSNGVNEFIKESKGNLPLEFDALQYEPYPWKPEHCILLSKFFAWELNISWWTDLAFSNLIQKFGEEKVTGILPDYPENAPMVVPSFLKNIPSVPLGLIEVDQSFRKFVSFNGTHIGSNNWVVNSNLSSSGKSIIANDPHLFLQAPGIWYAAIINSNDWTCAGVTIPGTPVVTIGKNEFISWVLTNVMADDSDFYIEKLDDSGKKYLLDGVYRDLSFTNYTIKVKDSLDYKLTVRSTHRGPIISGIHLLDKLYPVKENKKVQLSMRWVGDDVTNEFLSYYKINRAKNWEDFTNAVADYSVPGMNFVYADRSNNIGYICGAKIPIRSTSSTTFPFDGSTSSNDWKGFVPYNAMPKLFNPNENFIASANNKTISDFPYHISNIWEPPSRIQRIRQLLNSKSKHSSDDFRRYQMDLISPYAKEITYFFIKAFENVKVKDRNLEISLELLRKWNYSFNKESQAPLIYSVVFNYLLRNTFRDEMGENLFMQYVLVANVPYRTMRRLLEENNSLWFDNIKTRSFETRDDIIRKSFSDALSFLENSLGYEISNWQWGKIHTLTMKHFFHGSVPAFDKKLSIGPFEIGGDGTTVCNGEYFFNEPYENFLGPSMRFIYDFANPEVINLILPTGQSGNPLSKHYKDQTSKWLNGELLKIKTSQKDFRNAGYDLLILE